jgi:hypothetical protein
MAILMQTVSKKQKAVSNKRPQFFKKSNLPAIAPAALRPMIVLVYWFTGEPRSPVRHALTMLRKH